MDSVRRANLGSQMNGGLRSPKGKRERHTSRSVLRFAVPLDSISNPDLRSAFGGCGHTHVGLTRGYWGHCDISLLRLVCGFPNLSERLGCLIAANKTKHVFEQ